MALKNSTAPSLGMINEKSKIGAQKNRIWMILIGVILFGSIVAIALLLRIKNITGQVSPSAKISQTTEWKTFSISNYTIKYPGSWYIYQFKDESTAIEISDIPNPMDIPAQIPSDGHQRIFVGYYVGTMPVDFPYAPGSTEKNLTIQPFHVNGYAGIRGRTASTISNYADTISLQDGKGGYIAISNELGDQQTFENIVATFKFK